MPEIVYEEDETLQYGFEITAPGQAISGAATTFRTGTSGGVAIRIDFPRLDTIVEATGTASGVSTAEASVARIMVATGSASGTSSATASVGGIAGTTGASTGLATSTAEVGSVSATTGTASGTSQATAAAALIKATVGTSEVGSGGATVNQIYGIFE